MQSFRDAPTGPGIYRITNRLNNHFYVGQSVSIRERWYTHRHELNHGISGCRYLQNAWTCYSEAAFEFSVIAVADDANALDDLERWYIQMLQPEYNISQEPGTRRGVPQPPDAIARTSSKTRGRPKSEEWKRQARERRLGVKFPQAWADNIRASKQHVSAETRAKQSISAKRRGISRAATEAAAAKSRGKPRPPEVVERIREGQRRRWERYRAAPATDVDPLA